MSNEQEQPFQITPQQLKAKLDAGEDLYLLDVREPHEYNIVNIGGHLIPMGELPQRLSELDPKKEIVVYCHHGVRSAQVVAFLRSVGFTRALNLAGGIDRWSLQIDEHVLRY